VDWGLLAWVIVGAVAYSFFASVIVQWTAGRSPAFSIGLAVLIVVVLATVAFFILRHAAAALP
jgi:hypothetical protein